MSKIQTQHTAKPLPEWAVKGSKNKRATVSYNEQREAVNSFTRIGRRLGSNVKNSNSKNKN